MRWSASITLALALATSVFALSPEHLDCQRIKANTVTSPLQGCSPGTLFVSGTDSRANFTTVQGAINSLKDGVANTILIGAGEYHETVNVTRQAPLTLLGQLPANATLTSTPKPLVHIWDTGYIRTGLTDDAQTAVLLVAPNYNGSLIGAGPTGAPLQPTFGNIDFKAYNIAFENRAANYAIAQALVTDISYANASFYGCDFSSFQDTWYTGRNGSTYVTGGMIYGQTDYLFGFGTAWFQNVTLANRACGGGIVAWKGTNETDAPGNRYGAYIADSQIIRSPDANTTTVTDNKCYLGRPWNDLATTVFLRTYMDASIKPAGWTPFSSSRPTIFNTTFYAEYGSYGPGANPSGRVAVAHTLNATEAKDFTINKVFLEHPKWIDWNYKL